MHDMTPNVTAEVRAVYCHNPSPFYRLELRRRLSRIGSSHSSLFSTAISMPSICAEMTSSLSSRNGYETSSAADIACQNIVVAHPRIPSLVIPPSRGRTGSNRPCGSSILRIRGLSKTSSFCFRPLESSSRVALRASQSGSQSMAARIGMRRNSALSMATCAPSPGLALCLAIASFCFTQKPTVSYFLPSWRTWGMPISEFQQTGKPMLVIDLPYAHETVGTYPSVRFFPPGNPQALADAMESFIQGVSHLARPPLHPFLRRSPRIGLSCSRFFSTRNGVAV